jgi:UDP-2-acetamido-2-deoxy-ribo-hexuluronate aminotransferase
MDPLQCAVVLAKLERFDWEIERRVVIGARYNALLAGLVPIMAQRIDRTSVIAQYTVFVDHRDRVQQRLNESEIPTAVHYPMALHRHPAYRDACGIVTDLTHADRGTDRVLSLPMSPDLRPQVQDFIAATLIDATQ